MFKKSLLISTVLLSQLAAQFDGVYAGVGYGNTIVNSRIKAEVMSADVVSKKNMCSELIVGYGDLIGKRAYLGLEASFMPLPFTGTPSDKKFDGIKAKMTHKLASSACMRFGYVLGSVMPFLEAGFAYTETAMKSENKRSDIKSHGMMHGAGVDIDVWKNVKLGFTYSVTNYKSFIHEEISVKPSTSNCRVRLLYCF
jgi:opacity protein-like surface antigen